MSLPTVSSPTRRALARIDKRLTKLVDERETLLRQFAAEEDFKPCMDCFNGYCSMNCSSAPTYMKVMV